MPTRGANGCSARYAAQDVEHGADEAVGAPAPPRPVGRGPHAPVVGPEVDALGGQLHAVDQPAVERLAEAARRRASRSARRPGPAAVGAAWPAQARERDRGGDGPARQRDEEAARRWSHPSSVARSARRGHGLRNRLAPCQRGARFSRERAHALEEVLRGEARVAQRDELLLHRGVERALARRAARGSRACCRRARAARWRRSPRPAPRCARATSSAGTTSPTRPQLSASCAPTLRAVKNSSRVRGAPIASRNFRSPVCE